MKMESVRNDQYQQCRDSICDPLLRVLVADEDSRRYQIQNNFYFRSNRKVNSSIEARGDCINLLGSKDLG